MHPGRAPQRSLLAAKMMEEAYNHVPEMEGHDDEDNALLKYLGTKPEDIPEKKDRDIYMAYLKAHP